MASKKERLEQALKILDNRHFVSIGELAHCLDVSEMTVRRDVRKLAETGLVRLVYGGVAAPEKDDQKTYSIEVEQGLHTQAKQRIAQRATEFIAPGDVVFLDSGTTVQHFAQCLRPEDAYTIISYSLNTLNIVARLPQCTVIVPGGVFSSRSLVFSGVDAVNVIRKYRATKAFFGATGYEIKHGLTCSYIEEPSLKQAVMESSVERILLLDSSKFGRVSTCSFAAIKDFDVVITDQGISAEYADNIREQGPELLIVETE